MCVYPHISISLYFTAQRKGYNSVSEKMDSFARCTTGAVEKTPDSILQRSTHSTRLNCLNYQWGAQRVPVGRPLMLRGLWPNQIDRTSCQIDRTSCLPGCYGCGRIDRTLIKYIWHGRDRILIDTILRFSDKEPFFLEEDKHDSDIVDFVPNQINRALWRLRLASSLDYLRIGKTPSPNNGSVKMLV